MGFRDVQSQFDLRMVSLLLNRLEDQMLFHVSSTCSLDLPDRFMFFMSVDLVICNFSSCRIFV